MFTYNPEDASNAWPAGQYEAEIVHTDDAPSKSSGAEMLTVTYQLHHADGRTQKLKDYFTHKNLFRLRQLCQAISAEIYQEFKLGKLSPERHLRGATLLLDLKVEESPDWGDSNKVQGYAKLERKRAMAAGAEDDEVPF